MSIQKIPSFLSDILRDYIIAYWTHNSTAIEGNTLTFDNVDFFIKHGLTIAGKTVQEHLEVSNHVDAIHYLEEFFLETKEMTTEDLFTLHKIVEPYQNNSTHIRGYWKQTQNGTHVKDVHGNVFIKLYPHPEAIPSLMEKWLEEFNALPTCTVDNAVDIFAKIHTSFVSIHPFEDGNGRMARLLANIPLLRAGLLPIVIRNENRERYISLLTAYANAIEENNFYETNIPELQEIVKFCEQEWYVLLSFIEKENNRLCGIS